MKDIESFLKEGGLSNNESKTLISKIKEFSTQRDAEEKAKKVQREAERMDEGIFTLSTNLKLNQIINK